LNIEVWPLMKQSANAKQVAKNVAKALADVPIDNKQERDMIRARLRQTYAELKTLTSGMGGATRQKFEELGDLLDPLEECESGPPDTRS
jgi:hypothetical protein